jgi:cyanate permease
MLALVWLPYSAFGMISRSIAPLVTPILADLNMTYSQMGLVLGSWQLTYIIVGVMAGSITDRFGVRRSVFAGTLVMSLSVSLRYLTNGFLPFLLSVALFGAGAPLVSIGAPTVVAQWFSGKSRGTAVGIYTTSPSVGGLFALAATNSLVMPLMGFSWRLTFVFFGLIALAIAIIWAVCARDAGEPGRSRRLNMTQTFLRLIRVRRILVLFVCGLFVFAGGHGLTNWLPKLFEIRNMSSAQAGFLASVPLLTGVVSVLAVPALTPQRLRAQMVAVMASAVILALVLLATTSGALMVAGLVLFGIGNFTIFPLLMLILMDSPEVGPESMGIASGIYFAISEIGGFSGPLLMGTLFDLTGTFLAGIVFLAALNVAIVALSFRLWPRPQP